MFELGILVAAGALVAARGPLATPAGRQVKHVAAVGTAAIVAITGAAFAAKPTRQPPPHAAKRSQTARTPRRMRSR